MDGVPRSDLDAVLQMLRSSADPRSVAESVRTATGTTVIARAPQRPAEPAIRSGTTQACHASCAETTQFTMKSPQLVGNYGEYEIVLLQAPLAASHVESLVELLGHKGEPWLVDIRERYAGQGRDVAVVATYGQQPVSHLWISADAQYPAFATLGHVFTRPAHRRRGLARAGCFRARCSTMMLRPADCWCWEWTTWPPCHSMRRRISEPARARCARSPGHDSRSCADDLLERRWPAPQGRLRSVPFGTGLYASGILLLNAFPGDSKLQSLGILNGHEAELQLLEGIWRARRGESLNAFVDEATGCLVRDRTHNA